MNVLLKFSLKRRFLNKLSLSLQAFFIVLVLAVFFADKLSESLHLDFTQPYHVNIDDETREWLVNQVYWNEQGFIFTQGDSDIQIRHVDTGYKITGLNDVILQTKISELLLNNHHQVVISESSTGVYEWLDRYEHLNLEFDQAVFSIDQIKQQLIIVLLTSLYFMMLNFIAVNSNEIISEKTSHILSLLLSSIRPYEHFLSKLLSGLVMVGVQIFGSLGIIGAIAYLRYQLDEGQGLFILLSKYLPLPLEQMNFSSLLEMLNFNGSDVRSFILSLVFLFLGIVILQVLILILSSQVKTTEEAASIQGPFYLLLLVLYYGSLSLNTSLQLSKGLGYLASFIPVSSMLLMPMRLVMFAIPLEEIFISISFSLIALLFLLLLGYPLYLKGLMREKA